MVQAWLGIDGDDEPAPHLPAGPLGPADEERAIADFIRNFQAAGGLVH